MKRLTPILTLFFLHAMVIGVAQDSVSFQLQVVGLANETKNIIHNEKYLEPLFEQLFQQRRNNDRRISIIHIGDSHVQGDYLTQPIRRNFQQAFGNAGRGLVVPGRVAGTNESYNIYSCSNVIWNAKRCVHPEIPLPIGVSGITINSTDPRADIELFMKDPLTDYSFSHIKLFHEKSSSFDFVVTDTLKREIGRLEHTASDQSLHISTMRLTDTVTAVIFKARQNNTNQNVATIFGLSLENGNNGVLYQAIGVNGAKYKHYRAASYFVEQSSALKPDLIIISLGTNESLEFPYLDKSFYEHAEQLIKSLGEKNPNARFMLITPPDGFRNKSEPNPGIQIIRESIIRLARQKGFAFYDLFEVMGGHRSAEAWTKCGFLRADGIHFSRDGYEYHANLFFKAFINSYNNYVQHRHR